MCLDHTRPPRACQIAVARHAGPSFANPGATGYNVAALLFHHCAREGSALGAAGE
jgi:hypothetical protein